MKKDGTLRNIVLDPLFVIGIMGIGGIGYFSAYTLLNYKLSEEGLNLSREALTLTIQQLEKYSAQRGEKIKEIKRKLDENKIKMDSLNLFKKLRNGDPLSQIQGSQTQPLAKKFSLHLPKRVYSNKRDRSQSA